MYISRFQRSILLELVLKSRSSSTRLLQHKISTTEETWKTHSLMLTFPSLWGVLWESAPPLSLRDAAYFHHDCWLDKGEVSNPSVLPAEVMITMIGLARFTAKYLMPGGQ